MGTGIAVMVIITIIASFLFSSCAEDDPDIAEATAITVVSYEAEDSAPQTRLAVFVQMNSDVRRADCVKLVSPDSSYDWTLLEPMTISSDGGMWAGGVSFVMPNGESFPAGEYCVEYTDARGSQAQCTVTIPSDDGNADEREKLIAIYDEAGTLLYYGENRWTDDNDIWQGFNGASMARECVVSHGGQVVRMMPPRKKSVE